jgi:Fe-S oxidoreductase
VIVAAVVLAALLATSATLFAVRVRFLLALLSSAAPVTRAGDTPRRVRNEGTIVLGQRKLLQRIVPGLIHAFIFWGFIVLGPTIVIAMIGVVSKHATFPWLGHQGWYAFMVDLFAVLVLVGVLSALWIRKVQKPARFQGSHLGEADLILGLIATIALTLLLWHATRIALGLNEWPASSAPVSHLLSHLFADDGTTRVLERVFVWAHVTTILVFLAYLPRSKHLHIASAAFNVWYGRTGPGGKLETLRFDDPDVPEEDIRFGAGTAADLTWKEMLDTFSCTECGRCQDACPAFATGKTLSPKLVIMGLRDQVFADGAALVKSRDGEKPIDLAALVPTAVPEESVWDCVTCGACVQACPVSIEHVDHIVDLRRHLVMVESSFPAEAEPMLRDIERSSNPWGNAQSERADWADDLGIRILEPGDTAPEYLYWVGCASSFDERARATAQNTAKLLQKAGVDFAILGAREACTGDPARRMGNEYVFQGFAEQNVETLNEAGVTKIIANCPHCFNTLGNEYPDFGGNYEVIHHTQVLARLISEGRLTPKRDDELTITYHDSCYL